ncbi:hypothetical protein GCM10009422_26380 [Brevundimonas kwangchunensis]|uniref:PRC-barrel domain-containing protein n=1 Tax=Brevundimonas kwangchunensis TaxID=322163 RepID=A0ABN1H3Y7_9CAUL
MLRNTLMISLAASGLLAVAACSDNTDDDVVQPPVAGAAAEPVSEQRAETAQTSAALAFGMTRQQLEDADLMSAQMTDLGDVDTLVLDASGQLTHVVIELEGPGDRKVALPIADVSSVARGNGDIKDLSTTLTASELAAMPQWTRESAAR